MYGFDSVQIANYFGGEPIRTKVEVIVGKLKNGKSAGKDNKGCRWHGGGLDL